MKIMKKLSFCALAFALILTGVSNVFAYTKNITPSVNINIKYLEDKESSNYAPYIALTGSLKNNGAEVSRQEIAISKADFDKIISIQDEMNKYVDEQASKIDAKVAEQEAETDDTKKAELLEELETLRNEQRTKVDEYTSQQKALVPDFDDTKWQKLTLSKSTDTENQYNASVYYNYAYFITWVKVTIDGTDYYNYSVNCSASEEVVVYYCKVVDGKYYDKDGKIVSEKEYKDSCDGKKICVIENGKYYDREGKEVSKSEYEKLCPNPQTGRNVYYTYGIITAGAAFILYMLTRKVKKFSK